MGPPARDRQSARRAPKFVNLITEIGRLYIKGLTQAEVAKRLGISQPIVHKMMRAHGISARPASRRPGRWAGKNSPSWKGTAASYSAFHMRVRALRGRPKFCEFCKTRNSKSTYEWANISGCYDDPTDYRRLCRSCHCRMDGHLKNITKMQPV